MNKHKVRRMRALRSDSTRSISAKRLTQDRKLLRRNK